MFVQCLQSSSRWTKPVAPHRIHQCKVVVSPGLQASYCSIGKNKKNKVPLALLVGSLADWEAGLWLQIVSILYIWQLNHKSRLAQQLCYILYSHWELLCEYQPVAPRLLPDFPSPPWSHLIRKLWTVLSQKPDNHVWLLNSKKVFRTVLMSWDLNNFKSFHLSFCFTCCFLSCSLRWMLLLAC